MRELCRRGLDADTFRRQLRPLLAAVVAFDAYCVNTADPRTLAITSSVGDGLDEAEAACLFAIEHAGTDVNLLADLARGPTHVATIGAAPERSERMRTIFLPRGWVDELRAALVERGRCWGYVHLFRGAPFSPAERRAVASLVKDLARALRSAAPAPSSGARAATPGVLTFGRDGALRATTASTGELLAAIPVDERHGGPPHAIVSAAAAARARGDVVESAVPSRRGLLRVVALPESEGAVVIVDEARRAQVIAAVLARHRLSAREEDVCHGMLRGLSDKEIASSLGVGLETVKAHARSAFAKLSVSGRGGLVAKLGV